MRTLAPPRAAAPPRVGSGRTPAAAPRRAIVRRRRVVRPPGVALRAPDRAEARRRVRALVLGGAGLSEQHTQSLPTVERALAQLVQVSVDDEHRDHRRPVRTARSHGRPVEHARHDVGAAQRIALLAVQAADEAQELRGDRCVAVARRAADHHLKDLVLCHSLPHFHGVFRKPRVRHAVLANELDYVVVVINRSYCARNSLIDCSGERCRIDLDAGWRHPARGDAAARPACRVAAGAARMRTAAAGGGGGGGGGAVGRPLCLTSRSLGREPVAAACGPPPRLASGLRGGAIPGASRSVAAYRSMSWPSIPTSRRCRPAGLR